MIKKVLVPISAKQETEKLERAISYAMSSGADEIILLHVMPPIPGSIGGEAREQLMEDHNRQAFGLLKPFDEALSGKSHHCVIDYGEPADVIVSTAGKEGADLIIMLTDGHDTIKDAILGSVTERVLRSTRIPTLVIH